MNQPRGKGISKGHSRGRGRRRYHGRSSYDSTIRSTTNQKKELNLFSQIQGKSSYATYATLKEACSKTSPEDPQGRPIYGQVY